jgi:exopolysaccharide production protein ExoQ
MPVFAAVFLLSLLGPSAALAPRAMPIWFLAFAAAALWGLIAERRRPIITDPVLAAAAGAFVLWAGASALWSPSPRAALTALEIAYVAGGSFIIWTWLSGLPVQARRRLALVAAVSILAGMTVYGVENAFHYPINRWWNGDRSVEWISASNVPKRAAALLALFLWPVAALFAVKAARDTGEPWEAALIVAGLGLAVFLTSRSALAGLSVGAAMYVPALYGRAAGVRRLLQIGVAAAFLSAIPAGLVLSRAAADLPTDGWSRSLLHRMEVWGHAATRALEAPLRGQGVDASRSLPIKDEVSRFEPLMNSALPLHPHNAFLQVWLELGAAGAGLALIVLWRLLALSGRAPQTTAPCVLGYAACAPALASSAYGVWQAWWMCGLATGALLTALSAGLATEKDPP